MITPRSMLGHSTIKGLKHLKDNSRDGYTDACGKCGVGFTIDPESLVWDGSSEIEFTSLSCKQCGYKFDVCANPLINTYDIYQEVYNG